MLLFTYLPLDLILSHLGMYVYYDSPCAPTLTAYNVAHTRTREIDRST